MLAKRLLGAVLQSVGDPFTPFDTALYATKASTTLTRSDNSTIVVTLTSVIPVTYDPVALKVTFGAAITRAGLTRQIYGFPVRSSLGQVLLFGRDYLPAPVAPGATYPTVQGPMLPVTVTNLAWTTSGTPAQATTNITATMTSPTIDGSARSYIGGGLRAGLSFLASQDSLSFAQRSAAITALLAKGVFKPTSVQVTTPNGADPVTAYDGTMDPSLISSNTTPSNYTVNKLVVNGADVTTPAGGGYTLGNYPATVWFKLAQGSNTFQGSATAGPHSLTWSYTISWTTVRVNAVGYYSTNSGAGLQSRIYPSTPTPTSSGGDYMTGGSTTQTAQYSLTLPNAPVTVQDDPVTVGLYPLTQTCSNAPSSTAVATGYAETTQQYDAYVAFVAAANGAIPGALPKDGTTASVPWYLPTAAAQAKGGVPASVQFTVPVGQLIQASTALTVEFKTASAFAPYVQSTKLAASNNVPPLVTDTYGTCLATVTVANNVGTIRVEDFFNASTFTLNVDVLAATYNTGDQLLFRCTGTSYPTLPTTSTPDLFMQVPGTSSFSYNVAYKIGGTPYAPAATPFLWSSDKVPVGIALTGLPGTGVDPMFDSPTAGAVGRDLCINAAPVFLGTRNGTSYWQASLTSATSDIVPIGTALPGAQEATQTYNGTTLRRVGVQRVTRVVSAIVAVSKGVGTILPYSGRRYVTWYDLGQAVDSSGAPTGTYMSWSSPGQTWSRASINSQSASVFGTSLSPTALLNVGNADYAVGVTGALDLAATTAAPGAAANVKAISCPTGFSGQTVHLPHQGAILLIPDSNSKVTNAQLSTDLGVTWTAVTVSGAAQAAAGTEYPSTWPGSPLFAF